MDGEWLGANKCQSVFRFSGLVEPVGLVQLQAQQAAERASGYSRPLIPRGRASDPSANPHTKNNKATCSRRPTGQ